jgi:hypothetical protein
LNGGLNFYRACLTPSLFPEVVGSFLLDLIPLLFFALLSGLNVLLHCVRAATEICNFLEVPLYG